MFLDNVELIEIIIRYKKVGRHYVAYSQDVFNDVGISEEEKAKFSALNVKAHQLTWGLYNDLQEAAMVPDNLGNRKWNYKVYKENKLRKIISQWDAKTTDAEGKVINVMVNPKTISNMAPDIAEAILNAYDKATLIDDAEEKKS